MLQAVRAADLTWPRARGGRRGDEPPLEGAELSRGQPARLGPDDDSKAWRGSSELAGSSMVLTGAGPWCQEGTPRLTPCVLGRAKSSSAANPRKELSQRHLKVKKGQLFDPFSAREKI